MNSERPEIALSAADMLLIVDLLRGCADAEAEAVHNRLVSYFNRDMRYSATIEVNPIAGADHPDDTLKNRRSSAA